MINENWYQTAIKDYGIKEILYEELSEEKEKIGSGGFGKIYRTKCNSLGTVAIKEITIDDEVAIKRFIKELKLHSQIKHERIILFHGISRDEHKEHYLVLEFAKQGNLREFIKNQLKEGEFKWEERKRLAIQIAEGLLYLHNEKNIVHRDLHTTNILINDGLRERHVIGTPIEYKQIYVDCWRLEPNSRPLVEKVLSRLKSMSLEPVFEGDEPPPPDASEYIIPDDDLTIPTNNIKVIKDIEDGFFTATWLDGSRELWDDRSQQWERKGPVKIILRRLRCLNINKLKLYLELENIIIYCYGFTGFTQVPSTKSKSTKSYYLMTNYVHCNFHSGSILLQKDDLNHELEIYVSDLDFCVYSGEFYKTDEANKNNRHISPEILKGEKVSIKSDIYSLGVLMRELVSRNDPQRYYELMQKCLDDDPERRPDTKDLLEELHTFTVSRNSQFEAADSREDVPFYQQPLFPLLPPFNRQHFPPFPLPSSPFPPFYEQPLPPSPLSQPLSPSPFPQFYQPHDENENDTYDFDNFDNFFNL
ncbi:unnamed protein product [Rhizophagus irregularis]|nr:unnamed protein product [Rhizophagus irregularis]